MKVRSRILLLASLLLLVSVGGIVNLMWQIPRIDQAHDPQTILHLFIFLGLFGAGLAFAILELVQQEIRSPIFHLADQITRLKARQIDGHRLELTGSRDIDLLTHAFNELLDGFEMGDNLSRIFAETSPDMIFLLDQEGCVLFGNMNAARQWNYRPEEIIGKRQEKLFPPDIAERHKQIIKKIFETGLPFSTNFHEMVGERHRWTDARMIPVLDKNGHVTTVLGIFRDITERKQAEEALRASENKYRQLIETLQEGVWLIDKDANTAFVNPRMAEMLGYSVEEMFGKSLFNFMDERGVEIAKRNVERRKQGIAEQHDFEFIRKDGSRIYTILLTAPVTDEKGNYAGAIAGIMDITERKKITDELHQRQQELFHMQRVKSMGELASSLVHEINQPLAGILINAQAAQRFLADIKPDLDQIREILADIVTDDKRAGEVIHRLWALLQKEKDLRKPMDINSAVRNVMTLVHDEAIVRNVCLHSELAEWLPQVCADRTQIEQVILNLIMNAAQAMENNITAHKRSIVVSTVRGAPDGVVVSVRDTGSGIAKDKLRRVFEPFYTTRADGLGLGLTICESILAAHQGRIWAENNPDVGARFSFSLPGSEENAERGSRNAEVGSQKGIAK